jgi:hypothetical protein
MDARMDGVESVMKRGGELSGAGAFEVGRSRRSGSRRRSRLRRIAAATCRWLLLVGEFDRRRAWAGWGCNSCAHWLRPIGYGTVVVAQRS